MSTERIDYWNMPAAELADAWREIDRALKRDSDYYENDHDGTRIETLNFVEDAILQRMGAPDDASGDVSVWQEKIRRWAQVRGTVTA